MSVKRAYIKLIGITTTLGRISHFPYFPAKTNLSTEQDFWKTAFLEHTIYLTKKTQYDFWESPTTYFIYRSRAEK